jgi:hypothetical protein
VCRRDLMLRLCNFLRALLRIRRSADFVFGINQYLVNYSEPDTLFQPSSLSTAFLKNMVASQLKIAMFCFPFVGTGAWEG